MSELKMSVLIMSDIYLLYVFFYGTIYTAGKSFKLPPVVTNITSGFIFLLVILQSLGKLKEALVHLCFVSGRS